MPEREAQQQFASPTSGTQQWDTLWRNVHLATMTGGGYGEIRDAALAVRDGRIVWRGRQADLPPYTTTRERDGQGRWKGLLRWKSSQAMA
jgi:hypothetical protein